MIKFLPPVIAYLLGSISFAVIFTKLFTKTDVRDSGSGNAGTTNVLRVAGPLPGILTFLFDALKGVFACVIGEYIYTLVFPENGVYVMYGKYICAICCMLGHAYPVFFKFKGGKCAATSVGIFAVCCPLGIILGLLGYAVNMAITRIVSLSTLIATVIVVCVSIVQNGILNHGVDLVIILLTLFAGFFVFYRHKDNIVRLKNGTEKKLNIKK